MKIQPNSRKATTSNYAMAHAACAWACWNILKVAARVEALTEAKYGTVDVENKRS
jgi:hypothetical protein